MANLKKPRPLCKMCSSETARPGYIYCSNICQANYRYERYIADWHKRLVDGLQRHGVVSRHVKRFLRNKYNNKCISCWWSEVNRYTGTVPLVADHIDGDWRNNTENNLRLICPNCDSLTGTYAGLNRGNGRENRSISNRTTNARILLPVGRNTQKK